MRLLAFVSRDEMLEGAPLGDGWLTMIAVPDERTRVLDPDGLLVLRDDGTERFFRLTDTTYVSDN